VNFFFQDGVERVSMSWLRLIFCSMVIMVGPFAFAKSAECGIAPAGAVGSKVNLKTVLPEANSIYSDLVNDINGFARTKPGWKCIWSVGTAGFSKCEGFQVKLNVTIGETGVTAQVLDPQVGEVIGSYSKVLDPQSFTGPNRSALLKQAADAAADEAMSQALPCGGWSGQINYILNVNAPEIHEQMRDYSGQGRYETTIVFMNGVGTVSRHAEVKSDLELRQWALRNGARTIIKSDIENINGSAEGSSPVSVEVSFDQQGQTYQILPIWSGPEVVGNLHRVSCHRETCTTNDFNLGADQMRFTAILGKQDGSSHLKGTKTEQSSVSRDFISGQQTVTITWDVQKIFQIGKPGRN
jgi:hypothetical protein